MRDMLPRLPGSRAVFSRAPLALTLALVLAASITQVLAAQPTQARPESRTGSIHTDTLWAQSLGVRKALTVYLPPSYASSPSRRYPVMIYLHGLGGSERNWAEQGALGRTLDSLAAAGKGEAIVVMPDGDDGWYTTWNALNDPGCAADTARKEPAATYCVPWLHYDDYIAHDIVRHVDGRYRTRATRESRGIAGLSMGGYGAMSIALAYPQLFAAGASHSGVVSPRFVGPKPFAAPARYATDTTEMRTSLKGLWRWMAPPFGRDTIAWTARDPGRMAARLVARGPAARRGAPMPALLIDCGVDDPYVDQNRDLHATLTRLKVPHRYHEWPGKHEWVYWRTHAAESASFLLEQLKAR